MTTNLALASIKATGGTTSRAFGTRWSDIINVKDYGATGDGVTDDRAAIQATFDAAFGTTASPHGGSNQYLNKPVFFPAGNYKIGTPPSGHDALTIRSATGVRIFGSGMTSTRVFYSGTVDGVALTSLLKTNGFSYSHVEGISFEISGTETVAFNLDWDNTGDVSLNANHFADCAFSSATTGMLIGLTGFMGSENVFLNCYFNSCTLAGCKVANFNALQQQIIGGGADANAVAFYGQTGSFQLIAGVGFGINNTLAIKQISGDSCSIIGCRSEGANFIQADGTVQIAGCTHEAGASGCFLEIAGALTAAITVDGCHSTLGNITGPAESKLSIRSSNFTRGDYLDSFSGVGRFESIGVRGNTNLSYVIGLKTLRAGVARTYEIEATSLSAQSFLYENTTGQTFTVTIATPGVFTLSVHGLAAGMTVAFTTTGALPTGLSPNTTYYVISAGLTTNAFEVSATLAGAAINTSGSQSGVHTVNVVRQYIIGDQILKSNVAAGGSPGWICTTAGPSVVNGAASVAVFKALANVAA